MLKFMSHHGWTPLNVTSPHFVEKILSMNSRRSQTDVRKNPSFTRERSCSFRSFGLQCTVQYRTVMQRYDAHLSRNTLRVLSLTRWMRQSFRWPSAVHWWFKIGSACRNLTSELLREIVFKIKSCVSTLKGTLCHQNDSHGRFSKILWLHNS